MTHDQERAWAAYCNRMAETSYAMADWCEDPEIMEVYIQLGGYWVRMGMEGPPANHPIDLARLSPANGRAA